MKIKVYERVTGKDVTDEKEWYIDIDGNLCYAINDVVCHIDMEDGRYYYRIEFPVIHRYI